MKPSHLKRHLKTKHGKHNDKPVEFFLRKREELKQSKSIIQSCGTPVAKAQEASYRASLRIARAAQEDILFCQSLETRTTAEHIFQLLNAFIHENGLDWKKCVGVCTDGARAMTGRNSGVATRIREVAPEMRWTHCSIHREALAVKKMPDDLKSVLDSAVKTVNFIKSRPMNARLFHVLCEEMGSEHVQLLLHTEKAASV
uniref:Transposase n=2 Tax=Knipowitschia caucasica TaxID=637954 RepID=A0AAV2LJR0_KNICA